MFFNLVSTKGINGRREERGEKRGAEKKGTSGGSSTRRRQDKRRKGFKPRTRDKLACPAGGLRFLEAGYEKELRIVASSHESKLTQWHSCSPEIVRCRNVFTNMPNKLLIAKEIC